VSGQGVEQQPAPAGGGQRASGGSVPEGLRFPLLAHVSEEARALEEEALGTEREREMGERGEE